jgi:hypothetical protein
MAFDALPSDSVVAQPQFFQGGKSEDSLVTLNEMKGFKSYTQTSDNGLLKALPQLLVAENVSEQSQLDDQSKDLSAVLKESMTPEEYMTAFEDFMKVNGDDMYANAEIIDSEHPLEAVADSLNKALEGTGYTFRAAESENGVAISKDGNEAGTANVGPSMSDVLGIPMQ